MVFIGSVNPLERAEALIPLGEDSIKPPHKAPINDSSKRFWREITVLGLQVGHFLLCFHQKTRLVSSPPWPKTYQQLAGDQELKQIAGMN
jgi:hypothetical protein